MKSTKTLVALAMLVMASTFCATPAKPSSKYCKMIAYVINSNNKDYYQGQKICAGQVVRSFSEVTIVCINRSNEFIVKSDQELKKCGIDSVFPIRSFQKNRDRGDSFSDTIQLLSPSGKYLIEQRPQQFVWLPVKGAKKYIVKVIGGDSKPEYITYRNSLLISLPKNTPTFPVIIQSYSDIREISSNIYQFTILPENTNQVVNKYLNDIDMLPIQEGVRTSLKLSIFGEYNLIDESLVFLNAQVSKNPQDYESYLNLGDTQILAGMFNEARLSYLRAKLIAASKKSKNVEKLVQLKLNFIKNNQLDKL